MILLPGPDPGGQAAAYDVDARVIEASLRDPERFSALYDAYFIQIHRYVSVRLGADIADDLAAETFLVAFRKRHRFDVARRMSARPWLYGIATNLVARHRRDEARRYAAMTRAATELAGERDSSGHEERVAARVSAQRITVRLAAALAELAEGDRDVLLLVAVGGLAYEEVAVALGVPVGTVGSRLSRARASVRAALAGLGYDAEAHTGRLEEHDG